MVKKLDGHVSDEDYLMCKNNWKEFDIENMGN